MAIAILESKKHEYRNEFVGALPWIDILLYRFLNKYFAKIDIKLYFWEQVSEK